MIKDRKKENLTSQKCLLLFTDNGWVDYVYFQKIDHIITMLQSLNHYEKISSRSHSNYLAQISIEMTQTNNEINDVLSKLTALGSVLIPMNLVTGLWGMNVIVPGQFREDLTWFFCIMCSILTFCVLSTLLMRYYKII